MAPSQGSAALGGRRETWRHSWQALKPASPRTWPLSTAAYVGAMFRTGHDAANREAFRAENSERMDSVGLAVRGERKTADKAVKGLALHKSSDSERAHAPPAHTAPLPDRHVSRRECPWQRARPQCQPRVPENWQTFGLKGRVQSIEKTEDKRRAPGPGTWSNGGSVRQEASPGR
ncbi:DUF2000 family protein [Myxococcus sp. 1LA]